jgi:hypothetical protein
MGFLDSAALRAAERLQTPDLAINLSVQRI